MPKITPLSVLQNPAAKQKVAQQRLITAARKVKAEIEQEDAELQQIDAALTATYAKFEASATSPLQMHQIRHASAALKKVTHQLDAREHKANKRLALALFHGMRTEKAIASVEAVAALRVKARMLQAQTVASIASSESDLDEQLDDTLVPVDENGYVQPTHTTSADDDLSAPVPELTQAAEGDDDDLFIDPEQNALANALDNADEDDFLDLENPATLATAATADLSDYLSEPEGNLEGDRTPDSATSPLTAKAQINKRASAVTKGQHAPRTAAAASEANLLKNIIANDMAAG